MKRSRPLAAGIAGAVLLGSGLVALVTDSVTAPGNAVESPEVTPAYDIVIANATDGVCPDEGYNDVESLPVSVDAVSLVPPPADGWTGDGGYQGLGPGVCVRNVGRERVLVDVFVDNVVSTDLGCGPREELHDDGCVEPGDGGELDGRTAYQAGQFGFYFVDNLRMLLTKDFGGGIGYNRASFACFRDRASCDPDDELTQNAAPIPPGRTVQFRFGYRWDDGVDASQSDYLQFDLEFRAEADEQVGGGE